MQQTITRDLFISYSENDSQWVQGYLLDALGLPPERVITPQDFRPGASIVDEFERAVLESRYTLLVLSQAYLADQWLRLGGQLANFLSVDDQQDRLIPLRLDRFELPPQIAFRVALDFTSQANWPQETMRLCELLQSAPPSEQFIPCPYPGMLPFSQEDARRFYGRRDEIDKMIELLQQHRLLFVIGPSGSGKSSLVFAGLLPQLSTVEHFPPGFWRVHSMRPGAQPTKTLIDLLAGDFSQQPDLITTMLATPPPAERLLLVIDQFEELFTQAERGEQMRFIAALLSLRTFENCVLLITMRADFYPELMNSTLWPILPSQRLEVAPLRGAALHEAIERPAVDVGVYLEPALVERLLADGNDEPGVLPLLQETMRLLWAKRQRRLLTLSAYEQMGQDGSSGMAVAVATKADATLADLTPEEQQIARRILLCLVQLGENSPDTRRRQPLAELCSSSDNPKDFQLTLEHLTANRLVTRSAENNAAQDGQESQVLVDLSHEVLITSWPLLRRWLEEDRAGLLLHRRLSQTCDDWIGRSRDVSFLYGGSRLVEAQRYAAQHPQDISEDETEFLKASAARDLIRERSRYLGQAAGGALGAAFGYGLALGLGYWSGHNFSFARNIWLAALINVLVTFPVGEMIGFAVGLALWRWRHDLRQRAVATTLIGALVGSLSFALYALIRLTGPLPFDPWTALPGVIFGAATGLGVGAFSGWRRVGALAIGGVVAALLC
ncbi:MAG: TIR domain-containing protein, partial [Chloroflexi bacterium]|nr:TIR domain-containing protein [Chloroflexota bacterium]